LQPVQRVAGPSDRADHPEAISVNSAIALFIFKSLMLDRRDSIFARALLTATPCFQQIPPVVSACSSCLRFSSSSRETV
jgi:hypothetical protein